MGYQGCLMRAGSHLVPALDDLGVADSLVATLDHESPYHVGAAAATLSFLGRIPGGGLALFGASGAIPALVRVIERARPPADLNKATGLFRRYASGKPLVSY
jgi:hypothetical protein